MDYLIEPHTAVPQPTAVITATVPTHERTRWAANAHRRVSDYLRQLGVQPAGPPFVRTHFQYVTDLHGDGESVAEAGFPTADPVPGDGVVAASTLPVGPIAVTVHKGDPAGLDAVYDGLATWLDEHRCQPAGPCRVVYLIGPDDQPDPAQWRIQVIAPCTLPSPDEPSRPHPGSPEPAANRPQQRRAHRHLDRSHGGYGSLLGLL